MNRLAAYYRLSMEDESATGSGTDKKESNSIGNQRALILDYIYHNPELADYEVVEFCDDGYSGTNMDRPGMQKLLKEIKANRINGIIVKDMSRFSRDYIELGTYLNQIFPFMKIQFISINDNYDSKNHQGSTIEIDTAFKTLLYDLYSKDISVKVKSSLESKCADGEYVFGQVPFGYEKDKTVKNKVVVNEEEAAIVRYIFSLAMQGRSSSQIAKQLYEEEVSTIMQMRKPNKVKPDKVSAWSDIAIRRILNNRFYLGEMAYGKSVRKSVGSKDGIAIPKEDWKVIPDHHEAIISEEIFDQVAVFRTGVSTKRNREKHPLTGVLFCGGCRYSMNYKPLTGKNKYRRFECRKHSLLQIPECCTYFNAEMLEEAVLLMLNKELMLRGNAVKQEENLVSYQKLAINALKSKLTEYKNKKNKLMGEKDKLYQRYALGEVQLAEYQHRTESCQEQIFILSVKEKEMKSRQAGLEEEYAKTEADMKQIIRFAHIEELTQEVVDIFIKKIYVYKDKRLEIEWNFSENMGISVGNQT